MAAGGQVGWKDQNDFMDNLKRVQLDSVTDAAIPLIAAFDLVNLFRGQTGIDNFGFVRAPRRRALGA